MSGAGAALLADDTRIELCADKLVLGRCSSCDVKLSGPGVSRRHALLEKNTRGQWTIRDLNSVNGTVVNDRKLQPQEAVSLRSGDRLFFAPASAASPQAASFTFSADREARPISPCGLPPRPESSRNFRSPSPTRAPSPSPSFLPFVREVETALGLEISDQPVFRRRRRVVEAILALKTQGRTETRRATTESEISSLKTELQNSLASLRQLVEEEMEISDQNSLVQLVVKLKFALEEVLRRDALASRRWNALVGELNAKKAELKIFRDAASPHEPRGNRPAAAAASLRLRLGHEISDPQRASAAEVVVAALERSQEEISDLRRENLRLRAKCAALQARDAGVSAASDAAAEADADGRLQEVVRLRMLCAGAASFGASDAASSPPRPCAAAGPPAGAASGAATPEIRGAFWGERKIDEDFTEELLRDSLVPHSEELDEASSRPNFSCLVGIFLHDYNRLVSLFPELRVPGQCACGAAAPVLGNFPRDAT